MITKYPGCVSDSIQSTNFVVLQLQKQNKLFQGHALQDIFVVKSTLSPVISTDDVTYLVLSRLLCAQMSSLTCDYSNFL